MGSFDHATVQLAIPRVFDGAASQRDGQIVFLAPDCRLARRGAETIEAALEGEPVRLLVRRAPDYDSVTLPMFVATVAA